MTAAALLEALWDERVSLADQVGSGGMEASGVSSVSGSSPRRVELPGSRRFSFRYELLDSGNAVVGSLDGVESCTIEMNWLADIKRKASFSVRGEPDDVQWLSDRIKPGIRLWLPPYGPGDDVEWPMGVFLLSTPSRETDETGTVVRDVEGYDQLQVYIEDQIAARYRVDAGDLYTAAVTDLLGAVAVNITPSSAVLPTAAEWPPGTPKLKIINALLSAINYESLSFDEDGRAVVQPYRSPDERAEEYAYADDDNSLLMHGPEETRDLFTIPNRWVLVVSDPDRDPLTSVYTNTDPGSPTSTVRRGRTITDFRDGEDAADQATLDARASRLAFEASQVYEAVDFRTGMNPLHSGNDVYRITYSPLGINGKYGEHTWSMALRAGAAMQHRARRVVAV